MCLYVYIHAFMYKYIHEVSITNQDDLCVFVVKVFNKWVAKLLSFSRYQSYKSLIHSCADFLS